MAKLKGPKERIYKRDIKYSSGGRARCIESQKVIWESKQIAKTQAEHYRRSYGHKMAAYFCQHCRGWHIGHKIYHRKKLYLLRRGNQQTNQDLDIILN